MSVVGGTFDHICKQLELEAKGRVSRGQMQAMRCILEEAAESVHAHEEATRSGNSGGHGALSFEGAIEFLLEFARSSSGGNEEGEAEEPELVFTLFTTSMTGSRRVRDHDRRLKTLLFCLNIPFEEIDVSDNKYLQKKLGDAIVECVHSYGSGNSNALLAASPRVYRYCHRALNDDDIATSTIALHQQPTSNEEEGEFPTLATMSSVLSSSLVVGSAITSTAMRYALPVVFVKSQQDSSQTSPYGAYLGTYAELQMMVDEQDFSPFSVGGEGDEEDDGNNGSRFYNTAADTTPTTETTNSKPSLLAQVIQEYARSRK